jgi:hypothetical protein
MTSQRFIELEQELVQLGPSNVQSMKRLEAKRLEIEADEPPFLPIVDILCHNELMKAEVTIPIVTEALL